jgi:hypothetical protein
MSINKWTAISSVFVAACLIQKNKVRILRLLNYFFLYNSIENGCTVFVRLDFYVVVEFKVVAS